MSLEAVCDGHRPQIIQEAICQPNSATSIPVSRKFGCPEMAERWKKIASNAGASSTEKSKRPPAKTTDKRSLTILSEQQNQKLTNALLSSLQDRHADRKIEIRRYSHPSRISLQSWRVQMKTYSFVMSRIIQPKIYQYQGWVTIPKGA